MESIKNIGSLSKPIMYKEINQYLPPNKEKSVPDEVYQRFEEL